MELFVDVPLEAHRPHALDVARPCAKPCAIQDVSDGLVVVWEARRRRGAG